MTNLTTSCGKDSQPINLLARQSGCIEPMMLILIIIVVFSRGTASAFCFQEAGRRYGISPHLLKAIAQVESNMQPHAINHNKNGSVDYCHMQINSYWKKHLKERWQYLSDSCYCTMVGAWILKQCINRYGYNPDALVCYHTGKSLPELTPPRRREAVAYLEKINHFIKKLAGSR